MFRIANILGILAAALCGVFLSLELPWWNRSPVARPLVLLGIAVLLMAFGVACLVVEQRKED